MKRPRKRQLVRKPSIVSGLRPGQSVAIRDGTSQLIVTRKRAEKSSPEQTESELEAIFKGAPEMDCQAVVNDLRE